MELTGFERLPGVPLPLLRGDERACPYLPGRRAVDLFTFPGLSDVDAQLYGDLMDRGFRRSGVFFYKPGCHGCRECVPIRVPVQRFRPSASQRRVLRRNTDVSVEIVTPTADEEHYELYVRYQMARHTERPPGEPDDFARFLTDSPIETIALDFRVDGRLLGVSIVDVCPRSLSSVYFFYDPAESRRSLGVFSGLVEIEECRRRALPYWYIGFYVRGCDKMAYKSRFRPCELLRMDALERGEIVWHEAP